MTKEQKESVATKLRNLMITKSKKEINFLISVKRREVDYLKTLHEAQESSSPINSLIERLSTLIRHKSAAYKDLQGKPREIGSNPNYVLDEEVITKIKEAWYAELNLSLEHSTKK